MKKIFYLIPFISLIIFDSCVEQKIEPIAEEVNEITQARNWFDQNLANDQKGKISSRLSVADLRWDNAISFKRNNVEIIEVPMNGTNRQASLGRSENANDLLTRLMIFKRANKYESAIMEVIPTNEFLKTEKEGFNKFSLKRLNRTYSGLINFHEPKSNNIVTGYLFDNGLIVGKLKKDLRSNIQGRLDCYEIVTTYSTCSIYGCFKDYETISPYCIYTPDQNVYDQSLDPNDQYGGGGGSSDPSETPIELEFNISVDPSITSDQKANCIYNKLLNNEKFNEILKSFENNGSLNITFKLEELSKPSENGITSSTPPYNYVEIIIDYTNLQNHSTVEAARTFLHEAIHAKIFGYMYLTGIMTYDQLNATNFPELWDAYVISKSSGATPQHELMANMYIDIIAEGLRIFDVQNHNNPDVTLEHYRALAWDGLRDTQAYISLSQTQKDKIDSDRMSLMWNVYINCN